ncbi:hypothetical protein SLNWT_3514 [Streptomyces albus]|uniref:Uncharacterized protein n=1 Tax=Streptomyces albus (strain ATCC 21838 / DSM 41398 / FERM P-419 / JCM 4703 / NBRC 107858) TaxID=1081613 RepID=A0A0B5EXE3_STRA4|nr:hypothetical protein SLNWT_3514 [Streptomyces albus]AOU78194.1 hypothetical protein SLNHY_3503 [Streptomyces albus]
MRQCGSDFGTLEGEGGAGRRGPRILRLPRFVMRITGAPSGIAVVAGGLLTDG